MLETAAGKITQLSIAMPLEPLYPDNIYDLVCWARDYDRNNHFPVDTLRRFSIGFYQIHQGYEWKDGGINKYEAFAAAVIHFIIVAERCKLNIDPDLHLKLDEFEEMKLEGKSGTNLLVALSAAQQQIIYNYSANKVCNRASRYDPSKLVISLAKAIYILISLIPKQYRADAFYAATSIMTKELKPKKSSSTEPAKT